MPGATFAMEYANDTGRDEQLSSRKLVMRTVRPFMLERFEVTVGRFRQFLGDYDRARTHMEFPAPDAGAHPAFADSGWEAAWNKSNGPLPNTADSLEKSMRARGGATDGVSIDEPVQGVSWYAAFAFCIYDGGRLPTEAEWAYAAQGGKMQRPYPWSDDPGVTTIDHDDAAYSDDAATASSPDSVGSHPSGAGVFGQDDLAGNVTEWVADAFESELPESCGNPKDHAVDEHECLQRDEYEGRVLRGGSFSEPASRLLNVRRTFSRPNAGFPTYGFRCARDIPDP